MIFLFQSTKMLTLLPHEIVSYISEYLDHDSWINLKSTQRWVHDNVKSRIFSFRPDDPYKMIYPHLVDIKNYIISGGHAVRQFHNGKWKMENWRFRHFLLWIIT